VVRRGWREETHQIRPYNKMTLAFDIGASKIRVAEVSGTKIRNKRVVPNPKKKSAIKKTIFSLIDCYKKQTICIGIASFLKNDLTICTPNMDFENINLKPLLKQRYKVPVYVENDANCAALAEKHFGHGRGKSNFVLLTLGTGIGGGIIINNKLYRGARGTASEPGHMILEGKHLEQIASATATLKISRAQGLKISNTFELEELAKKGNKKALAIYNQVGKKLGIALLNLAYVLDPEIIILGGGFANVKFIYPSAIKVLHKGDWANRKIPVKHAKLKDDAGLIGAALLKREFG
jgi:predicted NBD/HSP70 family sugar kinase